MSELAVRNNNAELLEKVLLEGDLSNLTPAERLLYVNKICETLGLNPLTKPFDYLKLNGRIVLYAKKDATEQLRKLNGVSINIISREKLDDVYIVIARATDKEGRTDEAIGAVSIAGLKSHDLANAIMKAETKAKRRVTLSICGLGFLDESELDTLQEKIQPIQPIQSISNEVSKEETKSALDKLIEEEQEKKPDVKVLKEEIIIENVLVTNTSTHVNKKTGKDYMKVSITTMDGELITAFSNEQSHFEILKKGFVIKKMVCEKINNALVIKSIEE